MRSYLSQKKRFIPGPATVALIALACYFGGPGGVRAATLVASPATDKASIKSLAGCFEVTYQNAETFALLKDYAYHDRFITKGLEWIFVDRESEREITLQHLLIVPGAIIKHWRQSWPFENQGLYQFKTDNTWAYNELPAATVSGQWSQKVYQVDGSPRYECSAPWIHWGNRNYWECESDSPLPRREFTKRSDYNLLRRTNRHEITPSGHLHHEDNIKIDRKDGSDTKLVMEAGLNSYVRVEDQRCESAVGWWKVHSTYWNDVHGVWEDLYQAKTTLKFAPERDGKALWEKLFEMDEKLSGGTGYNSAAAKVEIRNTINDYLLPQ